MNNIEINNSVFEDIKHIDEVGNEYWEARELQEVLGYSQWRRFNDVIEKAKNACINSNNCALDHFANVGKMVKTGDSVRIIGNYKLSRYACYLITQIDGFIKGYVVSNSKYKCPHMKCKLIYNEIESTFDNPCHVSRFDKDGKCISGPSNKNVKVN